MNQTLTAGQIKYRKYKNPYKKKLDNSIQRFGGVKELVLKRDNYTCLKCGMTNEEHKLKWGREITIDHINGKGRNAPKEKRDNRLENLQTLCLSCHRKEEIRRSKEAQMKSSSVSDLGKEWRDKVRHYCRTIKPYNRILYEEDFKDIFNIIESVVSQAEQRGYERGKRELESKYGGRG